MFKRVDNGQKMDSGTKTAIIDYQLIENQSSEC